MIKLFKVNDEERTIEVTATFARPDYQKFIDKAQHSLAENVQIKGFRKGKVPFAEAVKYLKPEDIYNKMINSLIKDTNKNLLEGAPEEERILNRIAADVDVKYNDKEDTYSLIYTLALAPKAVLGEHKNLKTEAKKAKVGEDAINNKIEQLKEELAVLEECDENYEAQNGDTLNIDAVGYIDNKSFDGGTLKSYDIELGKHMFVGNFEEQLVGAKVGEKRGVDIVFPEHYIKGYENKPAHFDVTVNTIRKKVYPDVDDEFAKSCEEYHVENLADLKSKIKEGLEKDAENNFETARYNEIISKLLETSTFKINKKYLEYIENQELSTQISNLRQRLSTQGLTFEDYLSVNGLSEEDFQKNVHENVLNDVKLVAIQSALVDEYQIKGTEEDLVATFGNKDTVDSLKQNLTEMYKNDAQQARNYENQITDLVFRNRVKFHLLENNPVVKAKKTTRKKAAPKADEEVEKKAPVKKTAAKKTTTKKVAGEKTAEKKTTTRKPRAKKVVEEKAE